MNPLGLDASRFLVASDVQGGLLACGQLEPKPSAAKLEFHELRTLIVAKNARSAFSMPPSPFWREQCTTMMAL